MHFITLLQEVDFGLGPFAMSSSRAEVVDYTRPILTETARIVASTGRSEVDVWSFIHPFTSAVWGTTLICFLLLPIIVVLLSSFSGVKSNISTESFSNVLFSYFRVLIRQGNHFLVSFLVSKFF